MSTDTINTEPIVFIKRIRNSVFLKNIYEKFCQPDENLNEIRVYLVSTYALVKNQLCEVFDYDNTVHVFRDEASDFLAEYEGMELSRSTLDELFGKFELPGDSLIIGPASPESRDILLIQAHV